MKAYIVTTPVDENTCNACRGISQQGLTKDDARRVIRKLQREHKEETGENTCRCFIKEVDV